MRLMWMILFFGWVSTDHQLCFNPLRACLHAGGQGAKKVGFTAYHSGKLLLVCTSPRVF